MISVEYQRKKIKDEFTNSFYVALISKVPRGVMQSVRMLTWDNIVTDVWNTIWIMVMEEVDA